MRKLNKSQKKLIKEFWEKDMLNYKNNKYQINKSLLIEKCEEINDYETLWQDIDRLINDLQFSRSDEYLEIIKNFS